MDNLSSAITDEAIENLSSFLSDVFDSHFVRDSQVRAKVCRQLLADSSFVEHVSMKFDLEGALTGNGILGRVDMQDVQRPSVNINIFLTNAQKAVLVANNMDYNIVFKDGPRAPHALAYSQRVVDTARCKAGVSYRYGPVIDIGGNYATHTMAGQLKIHSCTLKNDVEEWHRQTQRDVNLALNECDTPSKCDHGVQMCDVYASEAFSLHTLPRIDPLDIPMIFQQHGFEYVVGVHHFDISMDHASSGYMSDIEMHWETDGVDVSFFFEQDSSSGYVHRLDWLKQYSKSNIFSDERYQFVVSYSVDRIENGSVYWTMVRLDRNTLGDQYLQPQYRYVEDEDSVLMSVPVFDEKLGYAITDHRAYAQQSVRVPSTMFAYVYKAAVSNDTQRPDLPLSFEEVKTFTQTFNYTRKIGGTSFTVDQRLLTSQVELIARGIYLIVVQRVAQIKAVTTEYTGLFKRIQNRYGSESFSFLLLKCFSYAAISPFVLISESVEDVVDLFAAHMRATIVGSKTVASVIEQQPYRLISPVQRVPGTERTRFTAIAHQTSAVQEDLVDVDVNLEGFYNAFKDELTGEHKSLLESKIAESQLKAQEDIAKAVTGKSDMPEVQETRESWEIAMEFVSENVKIPDANLQVVSRDEVLSDSRFQMYESGLYHLDVALNVCAAAKERIHETWTGTGYKDFNLTSRNNTTDLGMRYIRLENGVVLDNQFIEDYMVAMDPNTLNLLYISSTGDQVKLQTQSNYVFVFEAFKIFLGYKMGRKLIDYTRTLREVRQFKLSLIDGVPGCGKTHEIVKTFELSDLIVTSVKETSVNTRSRVRDKYPHLKVDTRVRTVDSCVLNGTPLANRVFVDEGLLSLPGSLIFIANNSRCKEMLVFGDSAQIGFIDRGSKLGVLRCDKFVKWENIEFRNISSRVPLDVCFVMRKFFPSRAAEIKTRSSIRRSVQTFHQPDIRDVLFTVAEPGVLSMTMLNNDKAKVLSNTGFVDAKRVEDSKTNHMSKVLTVHEAQGVDVSHTTVFRYNTFAVGTFDSSPHLLVALSRHTTSLKVISTVSEEEDALMKLSLAAINATEEELDSCMVETPDWLQSKLSKVKPRGVI